MSGSKAFWIVLDYTSLSETCKAIFFRSDIYYIILIVTNKDQKLIASK